MIEWLLITIAWIWGIRAIFTKPFIFWQTGDWMDNNLPRAVVKPLIRCPVCMPSIWGTYMFLYSDQIGIMNWIIFVISLAGINFLLIEFLYPENNVEILEEDQKNPENL